MTSKPISTYFAVALLALNAALIGVNWYLHPERAAKWAVALVAICLALIALAFGKWLTDKGVRGGGTSIANAVVFACLMIATTLAVKLAMALGAPISADFTNRETMALICAFVAFFGNGIPKTLTPLSSVQRAARLQSLQRLAGWLWVLDGVALTIAWFVLPQRVAGAMMLIMLPATALFVAGRMVWVCRTRERMA